MSGLVKLFTLSLLLSVTEAAAVKLIQALISMEGENLVGQKHKIRVTLYRD